MKQSDKRLIRKVKRKTRRAKVKTEIDRWRETVYAQLLDLDKRMSLNRGNAGRTGQDAMNWYPGVLPVRS